MSNSKKKTQYESGIVVGVRMKCVRFGACDGEGKTQQNYWTSEFKAMIELLATSTNTFTNQILNITFLNNALHHFVLRFNHMNLKKNTRTYTDFF